MAGAHRIARRDARAGGLCSAATPSWSQGTISVSRQSVKRRISCSDPIAFSSAPTDEHGFLLGWYRAVESEPINFVLRVVLTNLSDEAQRRFGHVRRWDTIGSARHRRRRCLKEVVVHDGFRLEPGRSFGSTLSSLGEVVA